MLPRMMGKPATMARKTAPIRVILDRVFVMKSLVACRTDAGDGAVVLTELVGNVHGVVLDRNVEVVERNDQQHVNDEVKSAVVVEHAEESYSAGCEEASRLMNRKIRPGRLHRVEAKMMA